MTTASETTRRRILETAFTEFYRNGFQGGSLNRIVEWSGTTKGALFHHFDGKQKLGYAVVDEVIGPLMLQRWLDPMADSGDPVTALQESFRSHVHEDIDSGSWIQGCPMNNLAQEMSPLDAGFQTRLNALYDTWREHIAVSLRAGIRAGTVRPSVSPEGVAALIVAAQMGIWGTGKSTQRKEVMLQATETLYAYLDTLRPEK